VRQNQPAVEPELWFGLIQGNVFSQQIFQIDKFSCSDLGDNLIRNWRVAGADNETVAEVARLPTKESQYDLQLGLKQR